MNKMIRPLWVLACLSASGLICAGAVAQSVPGLVSAGDYATGTLGSTLQPSRAAAGSGATYQVGKWPTYTAELAQGAGRDAVLGNCSMCHSVTYITQQPPLPAATWEAEVHKMIKTFGAPIQDAAAQEIITYLQAHYTPENRKQ